MDIGDPYLEDEQWDLEAMVLATIAGQLEDEEEEEEEEIRDECGESNVRKKIQSVAGRLTIVVLPTVASRRVRMWRTHPARRTYPLPVGLRSP